jgi:4-amino-4-deoxy-L-arabinose transferase-like glycosyltransferase
VSTKKLNQADLLIALGVYVAVWTLARGLFSANLDRYADMLEGFAWGQVFSWGSFKHPPLVGWIAGLWFSVIPTSDRLYFLLSYLVAAGGLYGVYHLARAVGLGRFALAAVLLQMCALPYTTLAGKFNANSILLLLWPWLVWQWWICVHEPGAGYRRGLILGLLAALSMLGKYYSGVLLLALGILTIASAQGRQWLKTPHPWIALLVFMVALSPHISWLLSHDLITLKYVGDQGGDGVSWTQLLKFFLAPIIYWGIALIICVQFFGDRKLMWWQRVYLAWLPKSRNDLLFWSVLLPYVLTLLFGLSGFVELSLPWSIPIGYGFPILWLRNLTAASDDDEKSVRDQPALTKWLIVMVTIVLAGSLVDRLRSSLAEEEIVYLPRREAAKEMLSRWDTQANAARPAWVGGTWAENAGLAFYGDPKIRVLPGLPDQLPAALDESIAGRWQHEFGLIYCPPMVGALSQQEQCEQEARDWLLSHDMPIEEIVFTAHRQGWQFPKPKHFRYVGFIVSPKRW